MASAQFSVNGSVPITTVTVAPAATVALALTDTSGTDGPRSIAWSIYATHSHAAVLPTLTPTGNPLGVTATLVMANATNQSFGIQCQIAGGKNASGEDDPDLTCKAIIGCVNSQGFIPFIVGEELERQATHGTTEILNEILDRAGSGGGGASNTDYITNGSTVAGATASDALETLQSSTVPLTAAVIAGAGMTGGGAFSAGDPTLNVIGNADGSITVNANDVQVGVLATDAQHGARGGGTQHAVVTTSVAGFMSAADKVRLDGIATGAQVNTVTGVFGRTGSIAASAGDYTSTLVTNASGVTGATVTAALNTLDADIGTVAGQIITDHGAMSGLSDVADHPGYLVLSGARAMTGALDMGGFAVTNVGNVDGVDVSAHASRHLPGGSDALTVAAPVTIGTANAAGSATSLARSDHVHAHGSQSSGSLHAVATTLVAGFMSTAMVGQLSSSVSHYGSTSNPHSTSIANIGGGTLAELNSAITDTNVVPTTFTLNTIAPLGGGGDFSENRTLTVSAATTSAVGVVRLTGDLGGTGAAPSVLRVNGATVPVAGALGTGVVLMASGVSALTYALLTTVNISSSAAIAATQLAAGGANNVLLGGASNTWGQITNAQISSSAVIAVTKLALGSANTVLWSNGSANSWTTSPVLYSVDVTNDVSIGSAPATLGGLRLSFGTDVQMLSYEGSNVTTILCDSYGNLEFGTSTPLRSGATVTQLAAPTTALIRTGASTPASFTASLVTLAAPLAIGAAAATTGDLRFNDEASVYGVGASGDTQIIRIASSSSNGNVYFGPNQSMGGSQNHTIVRTYGGSLILQKDGADVVAITGTSATFGFGSEDVTIGDGYLAIGADRASSGDIRLGDGFMINCRGASSATAVLTASASSGTGNLYIGPGTSLGGSQNHTFLRSTGGNIVLAKNGASQLVITTTIATFDFGDWPVSIADGALRLTDRAGTIPSVLSGNSVLFSNNDNICHRNQTGSLWELATGDTDTNGHPSVLLRRTHYRVVAAGGSSYTTTFSFPELIPFIAALGTNQFALDLWVTRSSSAGREAQHLGGVIIAHWVSGASKWEVTPLPNPTLVEVYKSSSGLAIITCAAYSAATPTLRLTVTPAVAVENDIWIEVVVRGGSNA